jgi:glycosyltransferase involved in cell wall biosynthesis
MNDTKPVRVLRFTTRRMIRRARAFKRRLPRRLRPISRPLRRVVERIIGFVGAIVGMLRHPEEPSADHAAFRQPVRVALYSPSNLNTIDGSSVWLQSTARVFHEDPRVGIVVPLRASDTRGVFTAAMRRLERVALVDSARFRRGVRSLPVRGLVRMLRWMDARTRFDIVILRGYEICAAACRSGVFAGRLWSAYIYEPERDPRDPTYVEGMRAIARASRYVVCQTDRVRRELEALIPEAAGKVLLIPPAIPSRARTPMPPVTRRLLYTGKLVPHYRFEELIDVFMRLRGDHPDLEFHVAGDKIPAQAEDPDYRRRVLRQLEGTPGLVWHGGISREAVMDLLVSGGVALNVWDPSYAKGLNDLVIPSKTLEYCSAGVPVVVQRTTAHEDMLGASYPFLVEGSNTLEGSVRTLLDDETAYRAAAERSRASAEAFSYESVYAGLKEALGDAASSDDTAEQSPRASEASR